MSNAAIITAPEAPGNHDPHAAHAHDPHLAHHFDTPEQQYASAKLGMWIFLGTEILMFGGLFCAYSVYRHNHPDVFAFAHVYLDKWLGAINTLVLITSSLTMAWAVRSSQLGHQPSLRWLMALTILGGYIFLGIKSVEYTTKWHHVLFIGHHNQFRNGYEGVKPIELEEKEKAAKLANMEGAISAPARAAQEAEHAKAIPGPTVTAKTSEAAPPAEPAAPGEHATKLNDPVSLVPDDPNAANGDKAQIRPPFVDRAGMAGEKLPPPPEIELSGLDKAEQARIYTFFGVYFFMTGLHGLHVVIGMSLIAWVLLRSLGPKNTAWAVPLIPASIGLFLAVVGIIIAFRPGAEPGSPATPGEAAVANKLIIAGLVIAVLSVLWALLWVPRRRNLSGASEFGPTYFTPVDLVGLYWHLVDMIWIFLFPLLYLIH